MKKVVSVSLGSSTRDHRADVTLLGEAFEISREGTDGKLDVAIAKVRTLDGHVDAIGLGGIDVYLYAGRHRYALRDGVRLLEAAKITPVVDGSGLKNTLEREAVRYVREELGIDLRGRKVLMVSALDRFGMAQALVDAGADVLFGDFIFALDKDLPVRDLATFEQMAEKYLPDECKLPFQFFIRPARNKTGLRSPNIRNTTRKPTSLRATSISCASSCPTASTKKSCLRIR